MDISSISSTLNPHAAFASQRKQQGNAASESGQAAGQRLSEEEQREVEQLKQRDREVRAHEAAHMAAAGGHARGGANFTYQRGPDGRNYAVGGEVSIDTSAVPGDPEATLIKAQQVQQAALAPAEPSSQDRQVAAEAAAMAAQARLEIARREDEQQDGESASNGNSAVVQRADDADPLMERMKAGGAIHDHAAGAVLHLIA